jgi:hypothetical protein
MTEAEAKTKWCCGPTGAGQLLHGEDETSPNAARTCLASMCMAWRATDNEAGPMDPARDRPPVWKAAGYCGLAGAPR